MINNSHKYTDEFEENVCSEHMDDINDCMSILLFTEGEIEGTPTTSAVRRLETTAEYGIRILMDYMVDDVDSPKEHRLNTIKIMT